MLALLLAGALAAPTDDALEARLLADLERQAPAAVDAWKAANEGRDAGRSETAAALYAEVARLAPRFDAALRRQCGVEVSLGKLDDADLHCRAALDLATSAHNELALAQVRMARGNTADALDHLEAAKALPEWDPATDAVFEASLHASAAWEAKDLGELDRWAGELVRLAPDEPAGWYYRAIAATGTGRTQDARDALVSFQRAGGDVGAAAAIVAALDRIEHPPATTEDVVAAGAPQVARIVGAWLGVWVVLAGATLALSWWTTRTSRRMLADPKAVTHVNPGIRKVYRGAMQLLCGVYYLSLPVVALLSFALGGGVFLLALALRRIWPWPMYAGVMTVVAVLGAAFSRVRREAPGERLDLSTEPGVRAVLDEVAAGVGTAPVDDVYLEPGTSIAVTELPSPEGTRRALILGVGVLDGMSLASFRAILAHEYGHFSHGDTAGGDFALRVRKSFWDLALGLGRRGLAAWYNPAWVFVLGFERLFSLTSFGASRLQELHADRTAARLYGAQPFVDGLTHVVRASALFDARAVAAVNDAIERGVPLANLYAHEPATAPDLDAAAQEATASLDRPGSVWDSHPPPNVRFAWVRGLAEHEPERDDTPAWSVFRDRAAIEAWMTAVVRSNVAEAHGVKLAAA